MRDPSAKFATARLASGALFVARGEIFMVRKNYGDQWDIPGGYVDRGESPASACEREVHEELGLRRTVKRLLVHDWAPSDAEGDKVLYIFDCGELGDDEHHLRLDPTEIAEAKWVPVGDVAGLAIPRLARRLVHAYSAYQADSILYLEHGKPRV